MFAASFIPLIVQKTLAEINTVRTKAKAIAQYFNNSSAGIMKLEEMQVMLKLPELKIKKDVPTRWN